MCYAEKTAPNALPYLSTAKSPQQAMGSLLKKIPAFQPIGGGQGGKTYFATVMPCFDKKLEASRLDFFAPDKPSPDPSGQPSGTSGQAGAEVDLVLTTVELLEMVQEAAHKQGFADKPAAFLDSLLDSHPGPPPGPPPGEGGGAAQALLPRAQSNAPSLAALLRSNM